MNAPRAGRVLAAVGCLGLVGATVGSFLPWLRSGSDVRNSYATIGVLERVVGIHGAMRIAMDGWPYLGVYCAAVLALAALRLNWAAGVAGILAGGLCLAVAIRAMTIHATLNISVHKTGPIVTLIFAGAAVLAFVGLLVADPRARVWRDR